MSTAQPSRISRLLALVPYLTARRGIAIEQAASDLGVTPEQLTKDLEQLFVCGLPGYYPDDLIDLEFSEGHVDVGFTAGMDRPLRLTSTEASTLLIALRALVDTPGVLDRDAARRAIAKIEAAVGSALPAVAGEGTGTDPSAAEPDNPTYAAVREAVRSRRALELRYYSATRDSVAERVVDPIRLQAMDNRTYLEAWCRPSQGVRLFRFDRIEAATVLDEPAAPPAEATAGRQSAILTENPELPSARIEIDPAELWILDYFSTVSADGPVDERADPDAPVPARVVYGSPEWLTRFLLGFGGRVRVIDDADVADAVGAAARAARARYR